MGKKADALREELEIKDAELEAERKETARLRELLVAAAGGAPIPPTLQQLRQAIEIAHGGASIMPGSQAVERFGTVQQTVECSNCGWRGHAVTQLAASGHCPRCIAPLDIAPESGSTLAPDEDMQAALAELRSPSSPVERKETALDIVRANNRERAQLHMSQRQSNAIISRVASALNVPRWDADGTEILEKAQRFGVFATWLSRRLKGLATEAAHVDPVLENIRAGRMDEIKDILAALVAPPQLSKFLHERKPPTTPGIFDTALSPGETVGTVGRGDLIALRDAWAVRAHETGARNNHWLTLTVKSEVALDELVALLNLVLIPTLVRLGVVTDHPAVR